MEETDAYLAASWRVFEGVREHVHHHLVEILTVNPDGEPVDIMFVGKGDLLGLGLILEEVVDVLDEAHKVGLRHAHLHLALVNLSEVHHLVDKAEDTLGITLDGLIDIASGGIVVVFEQREQRCDDEGHRGAYLVAHVHEETQLGLAHLLGVDMCLEAEIVLLTVAAVGQILPDEEAKDYAIEEVSPCRAVPGTVDDHGELALSGLDIVALSLHTEAVSAFRQVGKR